MNDIIKPSTKIHTIGDAIKLSKRRLPKLVFDFIDGASGDEKLSEINGVQQPEIDIKNGNLYTYNWPGNVRELRNLVERVTILSANESKENINKLMDDILTSSKLIKNDQNFFEKSYGFKVILFPSARAGIASILRFLKIDRSNEVFVNKWVSHCIFNTVGRYTNISTRFKTPDVAIAVHKWGFKQMLPKKKNIKIIED